MANTPMTTVNVRKSASRPGALPDIAGRVMIGIELAGITDRDHHETDDDHDHVGQKWLTLPLRTPRTVPSEPIRRMGLLRVRLGRRWKITESVSDPERDPSAAEEREYPGDRAGHYANLAAECPADRAADEDEHEDREYDRHA